MVKKGQEMRDRELMEMCLNEMNEDSEVNRKKKIEVMRKIKKKRLQSLFSLHDKSGRKSNEWNPKNAS